MTITYIIRSIESHT